MIDQMVTIDEVADIYDGPHATPRKTNSGPYFLSISSLENGRLDLSKSAFLSEDDYNMWTRRVTPQKGDLLFSYETRLGEAALMPDSLRACLGRRMGLLRPKQDKVIPEYLLYAYLSPDFQRKIVGKTIRGATVDRIALKDLPKFKVRIPDFEEQKQVVGLLKALDTRIELNNRINVELETLTKTIYNFWFTQFDFPDENDRPYKSSGGALIYNELIKGYMPSSWEAKSLYDIAIYTNGIPCQKYRPKDREKFLNVIKIREMSDGFTDSTERVSTSIPDKVKITNGDVLFSWSASLEVILWGGGEGALNQHIFKVTSSAYPKSFYYFKLLNYLKHFKMLAENRKTTMGHITIEHLQQAIVSVPPRELAERLDNVLSPILSQIVNRKAENKSLVELRDWLLPMLMNGQVKVNANSDSYLYVTSIHRQAETALIVAGE